MDSNRYIASKIGLAREISGMSIATLARRAGMTPQRPEREPARAQYRFVPHEHVGVCRISPWSP